MTTMNRFSLTDFLAYLFPGATLMAAIWVLIHTWAPSYKLPAIDSALAAGALGLAISYVLGILCSTVVQLFGLKRKHNTSEDPMNNSYLKDHADNLKKAFSSFFYTPTQWSKNEFYAMRVAVQCSDPNQAEIIQRQNSLRQIRQNTIFPIIIWGVVGISKGYQENGLLKYLLLGISVSFTCILVYALNRAANRNRKFEVRDCCLSFLSLYKLGKLEKNNTE